MCNKEFESCWEETKPLEGLSGHNILRQKSINKYYESPTVCRYCGNIIKIPLGRKASEIKNKKFCNHSCSASFNNKGVKRHGETPNITCKCGGTKFKTSHMCQKCRQNEQFEKAMGRALKDISSSGNARVKWASLRSLAKRAMQRWGLKKECRICGFKHVVHVCHIKPISEFSEESLVGEVNSKGNLVYLCPNHHAMLDKGMISLNSQVETSVQSRDRLLII